MMNEYFGSVLFSYDDSVKESICLYRFFSDTDNADNVYVMLYKTCCWSRYNPLPFTLFRAFIKQCENYISTYSFTVSNLYRNYTFKPWNKLWSASK